VIWSCSLVLQPQFQRTSANEINDQRDRSALARDRLSGRTDIAWAKSPTRVPANLRDVAIAIGICACKEKPHH
jgi:hypothetical protein